MFEPVRTRITYPVPQAQQTRTLSERMALSQLDVKRAHALQWMRSHRVPVLIDRPHMLPWLKNRSKKLPNPPF